MTTTTIDHGALALPASAPAGRAARRGALARASTVLLWGAVALAVAVAVAAAAGYRTEVVLTGSMRPALAPNDMVLVHGIAASEMKVGDIVSFAAPEQQGVIITHRVRSLTPASGDRIAVVTRGDANTASEHWTIARGGSVARVFGTLPGAGAITNWAGNPSTRALVVALLGLIALAGGLRWVWRQP